MMITELASKARGAFKTVEDLKKEAKIKKQEQPPEEKLHRSFYLSKTLMTELRIRSANLDKKMSHVIEEALRSYFARDK